MGRPRTFVEADVVAAVREQLRRTGYAATSIDDLGRASGLGRGSLYGAFGDKRNLALLALNDYCDRLAATAREHLLGDDAGAMARLTAFVLGSADRGAAGTEPRGCLAGKLASELAASDLDVERVVDASYRSIQQALQAAVEGAQRNGDLQTALDPVVISLTLFAVLRGMDALAVVGREPEELRVVADTVLSGLTAR